MGRQIVEDPVGRMRGEVDFREHRAQRPDRRLQPNGDLVPGCPLENPAQQRSAPFLVLAGDMGENVSHPMHPAQLEIRAGKKLVDGRAQPAIAVGDDQLDASKPAPDQRVQKLAPVPARFGSHDRDAQNVPAAVLVDPHGHRHGAVADAVADMRFHVGRVEVDDRPVALQLRFHVLLHALADALAHPADRALGNAAGHEDPGDPVHPPRRYPADPCLPEDRDQLALEPLPTLEEGRIVGPLAKCRDLQDDFPRDGLERHLAEPVPPCLLWGVPGPLLDLFDLEREFDLHHFMESRLQESAAQGAVEMHLLEGVENGIAILLRDAPAEQVADVAGLSGDRAQDHAIQKGSLLERERVGRNARPRAQ